MANLTNSAKLIEEMSKKAYKTELPTVNNATVTVAVNGNTWTNSFTTNQASNSTLKITVGKSDVGLWNVDNTSDANKPISTATQAALDLKADKSEISSVYKYKGSKANYDALPSSWNVTWDVWNVEAAHTTAPIFPAWSNLAWDGSAWDVLWGTVDLSWYQTTANLKTSLSDNSDTYYPSQKAVKTAVDAKQDTLTSQTAYTSKGSATKVPQISTNSLWQVTGITEVTITQPTVNDWTLTITQNWTSKGTFTANQSSAATIALTDTTYESKAAASWWEDVSLVTTWEKYTWNNKQNALTTQTAYTSKWTASKVPQITTNNLWQVTWITEVNITYPSQVDDTAYGSSWNWVTGTAPSKNAVYDAIESNLWDIETLLAAI